MEHIHAGQSGNRSGGSERFPLLLCLEKPEAAGATEAEKNCRERTKRSAGYGVGSLSCFPGGVRLYCPSYFFTTTGLDMEFTEKEQAILRIVQKNIPDSLTPYADIAAAAGTTEEDVLHLLLRMKESGAIRRFGASIKHQRTGWTHNAMVAWVVSPEEVDEVGRRAAEHPRISHCYYRPSPYPAWPYTFYTMIHGKSEQDCLDVVEELRRTTSLETCEVLESLKELKKISMTYFAEPSK